MHETIETFPVDGKVLTALWTERVTKNEIAERLAVPAGEIENLLFGLATSLPDATLPLKAPGGLKLVSG